MLDEPARLRPVYVEFEHGALSRSRVGALVRTLLFDEVGGHHEAVLQVVDPQISGLPERDGAEVPGHLDCPRVRFFDRGPQLIPSDVLVCLERGCAFISPVTNQTACLFGVVKPVQKEDRKPGSGQIRTSHVHSRTRLLTAVDYLL